MLISFEQLTDQARIWIYQADRKISSEDVTIISEKANQFFDTWAAHGAPLKSAYKVLHDQFLIVGVDEAFNQVSGCSIDASVHFVQQLEQQLMINFFDRTKVAFLNGDEILVESLSNLKTKVASGEIVSETPTFNNLITTKKELEETWMVPAQETWLKRYFN